MRVFLFSLCLLFGLSHAIAGGGWVYKQGNGYLKLTQWWAVSPLAFDAFGNRTDQMPVGYFTSSFYGEVGLTNRVTGIVFLPFFSRMVNYQRNTDPLVPREFVNGVGDVDISFKYGIIRNQTIVASATVTAGIPFGKTGQGINGSLATGDGEFNIMFRLDASASWRISSLQGWLGTYGAHNSRSLNFNDEWRYGAELGVKLWKDRLLLIGRADGIDAIGPLSPNLGSIFSNNIEHFSLSGELGVNLSKKIGIAGTFTKALRGKSFYVSPSYAVGVYMNI